MALWLLLFMVLPFAAVGLQAPPRGQCVLRGSSVSGGSRSSRSRALLSEVVGEPVARQRRVWHMINLTNGLELLKELLERGHSAEALHFCRLQSSHCEARDFEAVLRELDHNMLLRLAVGDAVVIHDCGSRGLVWPSPMELQVANAPATTGFDEELTGTVPRAVWWGLEWVRYVLRDIWHLEGEEASSEVWLRGCRVTDLFRKKAHRLPKSLRKRLRYYRGIAAAAGTKDVLLYGASRGTDLDGKKDVYYSMLLDFFDVELRNRSPTASYTEKPADESFHVLGSTYLEVLSELQKEQARLLPEDCRVFNPYAWATVGRSLGRSGSIASDPGPGPGP